MTRFLLFLLAMISLVGAATQPQDAGYNLWTGAITCLGRAECLHEAAHRLDAEAGWISDGYDFRFAVDVYRWVAYTCPTCRDDLAEMVMFYPGIGGEKIPDGNPFDVGFWRGGWGGRQELYAEILSRADGRPEKMPAVFREFYDFKRLDEVINDLTMDPCN